jgi:charged multivesicular body protein 5
MSSSYERDEGLIAAFWSVL